MAEIDPNKLDKLYNQKGLTQREIAEKLDVTQPWISKKMKEHGINTEYTFWSDEEEKVLEKHYKKASKQEITSILSGHSWKSIKDKAIELGLSTPIEKHRKSPEVLSRMRKIADQKAIEPKLDKVSEVSYIMGVMDGDGYSDNEGSVGLEVKSEKFAEKFCSKLELIGLNPSRGSRRENMETVWASSKRLVEWLENFSYVKKEEWLFEEGDPWKYIEGAYDSDGDLSNPGPRICSYDQEEKEFLLTILDRLGLDVSLHSNNVYVSVSSKDKFFRNVDPVISHRRPE